ncbi:MAG: PH domain-containing protein [Candidatus Poseidoniia archaeon]|nr:PH domain-containing protein [Candidatus Poseidoniia archaeon]
MARFSLMRDEEMKLKLQPHPLSFLHLYFVFFLLLVWGFVIYRFFSQDWFSRVPFYDFLNAIPGVNEVLAAAIIWSLALLGLGFTARFFFLENGGRDIFRLYGGLALFGIGAMVFHLRTQDDTMAFGRWFIPLLTLLVGGGGMVIVDQYRRSFTYYLTDIRIAMHQDFLGLSKNERQVRYNHIEDIKLLQSFFGRIFGFGTVVPVTGSGLGTGTDEAMMIAAVGGEAKGFAAGLAGGSRRSARRATQDPRDSLYGVPDPGRVRDLIAQNIQDDTGVEHLKRIEELLGKD